MLGTPNPIAFSIFGMDIRWYAIMLTSAMIVGFFLAEKRCKMYGLNPEIMYDFLILAIPIAILGARSYYVLFNLNYYSNNIGEIYKIWHGGLAIHGCLIGGTIAVFIMCQIKKVPFLKMADIVAPCIILAQAIGRWGNFFNMEAYGSQTTLPWAIKVIDAKLGEIMVHPTFLYESIWNLFIFFLLIKVFEKRKKHDGELICYYMIFYSIGRFFIEALRTDSLMLGFLKMAQVISIIGIVIGIIGLYLLKRQGNEEREDVGEE